MILNYQYSLVAPHYLFSPRRSYHDLMAHSGRQLRVQYRQKVVGGRQLAAWALTRKTMIFVTYWKTMILLLTESPQVLKLRLIRGAGEGGGVSVIGTV